MLDVIAQIVEQACAAPENAFGYGIWTHHMTAVVENGRRLAPLFGANAEIVELAALLHDYAGITDHALHAEHHVHGPVVAERLLRDHGYPEAKIAAITYYVYVRLGMPIDDGAQWVRSKVERSWARVDPGMRDAVRPQYDSALRILAATSSAT